MMQSDQSANCSLDASKGASLPAEPWTPRQRVLAAIEHREPDQVPCDLGSNPSSGISAMAYNRLKAHLGMTQGSTRVFDVVQQLAQPEACMLDTLGADVLDVGRVFNVEATDWKDVTLSDGSPAQVPSWFNPIQREDGSYEVESKGQVIARMPARGAFFDQTCFPYVQGYPSDFTELPQAMDKVLWAHMAHSPWDHAGETDFWTQLRDRTGQLRASTDRALMLSAGCNLFEWGSFLRRMDNFLMDLAAEPAQVARLVEALMERHRQALKKVCDAVGDRVDILRFGDDLGMMTGPFMSPQTYRALFKPYHTELNAFVHKHTSMKTMLHSCGSIYALLPDLIEAGYDIINPVQTSCQGMDPASLKREFGRDITFWGGGCDTASVLPHAAPSQIREHVLARMEIFSPGGGFVFNTVHNILPEVPPENIVALFDAVKEFNRGT